MFSTTDIKEELISHRAKAKEPVLELFNKLLTKDIEQEDSIIKNISLSNSKKYFANLNIENDINIFSQKIIEDIAVKYRLRFLPTKYFKNKIPQEAIFKIKEIEKSNSIQVKQFYILAPSEAFDLEDCNKDPLLFIPLKNNKFYLVHKWGSDLSWLKKISALPFRSLESMVSTVAITAFIITLFTPTWLILNGAEIDMGYFGYHRLAWFFYSFIMLCSLTTFICFSQGIYPSEYQWNKKTYN